MARARSITIHGDDGAQAQRLQEVAGDHPAPVAQAKALGQALG